MSSEPFLAFKIPYNIIIYLETVYLVIANYPNYNLIDLSTVVHNEIAIQQKRTPLLCSIIM